MGTRSRQFRRVSSSEQDSAKQLADLAGWDAQHGYEAGRPYIQDGKSAFHGEQIPELEKAVSELEAGEFDVLTFWKADRMWRGASLAKVLAYVERIHEAGGRVEFVKDVHLNIAEGIPAYVRNQMLAMAFGVAHAESEAKRQRSLMDIQHHKATGSAHGRAPYGYAIQGTKDAKRFVPTDTGRAYVPEIFARAVQGDSLRSIAAWLTAEGVKTDTGLDTWNEGYLARMIANPVYYGSRRNGGTLQTEALVSFSTWQQAGAQVASRARPGRTSTKQAKALLAPRCGNPECHATGRDVKGYSPMYRIRTFQGFAYRCAGSGPQRKGCGNMVDLAELDAIVMDLMTSDHANQHYAREFVPGDDNAEAIGKLREAGASAMRDGDYQAATLAMQQAAELEAAPSQPARWDEVPTGLSEGEWFASLDDDARRAVLASQVVWAWKADGEVHANIGPRAWMLAA